MRTRVFAWVGLSAVFVLCRASLAADPPRGDADLRKFQGTWTMILGEREGRKLSEEEVANVRLTIAGSKYSYTLGGRTETGTLTLDPSRKPGEIDVTSDEGKAILGIYEIEGNTHKVCFAEPGRGRPTEFSTLPEGGRSLYVMRRVEPAAEAPTVDQGKLQGTWQVVSQEADGEQGPDEIARRLRYVFQGDRLLIEPAEPGIGAMSYQLDPTKEPRAIDLTFAEGPQDGKSLFGIYLLAGDDLKICLGQKRPTTFATEPGSGLALIVLRRPRP
jgi:uncharacterized protein (TIGR03067 family)